MGTKTFRMFTSLAFDGHVRNISNLNFSFYLTFIISILLELPADLLAIWGLNSLGRRWSATLSLALSSVAMIICAFMLGGLNLIIYFLHLSFLPTFLQLVFQLLISAQTGFSIGAWKPSGLDY